MNKNRLIMLSRFCRAKFTGCKIPLFVGWDLTDKCNFNCRYCRVPLGGNTNRELNTEDVLSGISQLADLGTVRIHFGGGEALLREDIGVILEYCRDKGIFTSVLTNGMLVAEKLSALKKADLVKISFDGPQNIHDDLRQNGSYNEVVNALELCKRKNINTALNVTVSQSNMNHIRFILDFSFEHTVPIKFQLVNEFLSGTKDVSELVLSPGQQKEVMEKILARKHTHKYIVNSYAALRYMRDYPHVKVCSCCAGKIYVRISANGGLYPCMIMKDSIMTASYVGNGVRNMMQKLPALKCAHCLCTSTLEVNFIYNLNSEAVVNNLRKF